MSTATSMIVIEFVSPSEFRTWLAQHHATTPGGIWIRFFKKRSRKRSITYDEAVDEALCYGWIDGQGKSSDDISWIQRFTPRRPRSVWSRLNTERIERLTKAGRLKPAGLAQVEAARKDGRWQRAYASPSAMEMPEDFLVLLSKNRKARAFFDTLNRRNTYAIAYRLQSAKKRETRERRMSEIVAMLSRGEKFYP